MLKALFQFQKTLPVASGRPQPSRTTGRTTMSTMLFPSPIFGPVHSRRLGVSLGINLLPADGKICSFDCIYCECGLNGSHRPHLRCPSRALVVSSLEEKLVEMAADGVKPDNLTFAGNGEPHRIRNFRQLSTTLSPCETVLRHRPKSAFSRMPVTFLNPPFSKLFLRLTIRC